MNTLTLLARAKLNLFLHITGQRHNGYHQLESAFQLLDENCADRLTLCLKPHPDTSITSHYQGASIPHALDLCHRAATLLYQSTQPRHLPGVDINCHKHIPIGTGMGGGSADAATVLLGLNRLWNLQLPTAQLAALALQLGADVPFFLHQQNALATGIGEVITPMPWQNTTFAIVCPGVVVPTAQVFSAYAEGIKAQRWHYRKPLSTSALQAKVQAILLNQESSTENTFDNDLEPVVLSLYPELAALKTRLQQWGRVRMTGSGSAFFLLFPHRDAIPVAALEAHLPPGGKLLIST